MIRRLWVWPHRRDQPGTDDTVNATHQAQALLDRQQAAGTHNPAAACETCGTWRTPGVSHTKANTGPRQSAKVDWCDK